MLKQRILHTYICDLYHKEIEEGKPFSKMIFQDFPICPETEYQEGTPTIKELFHFHDCCLRLSSMKSVVLAPYIK